ncbi:NAC domain-containing protein 83 [Mercurialis annua]|uniref:NAC domain-containing protein 83 n=1 Tax=Mercurialis annua TaxID=3986 RepID=UPI00215EC01A|nr:NAC domain-containing protein 83 [Mercurialis annua]
MAHKLNFIRDGMTKLPPGFRFQPTDEELVFEYLKRKVLSWPLPASVIPDLNVYSFDPWDLPGDVEQERYFFCKNEANNYPNGNRINYRPTASGYWKPTGVEKQIISCSSSRNHALGFKKTLIFYKPKPPHASSRTHWVMHEYRLVTLGNNILPNFSLPDNSAQNCFNPLENWVLCKVFFNNTVNDAVTNEFESFGFTNNVYWDSISSCSSSSSSSSDMTEVSSSGEDDEQSSSCSRNFI